MSSALSVQSEQLLECFGKDNPEWENHLDQILAACDLLCDAYHNQHLILTCGNGGSASDALHITGELVKSFVLPRRLSQQDQQAFVDAFDQDGQKLSNHLVYGLRAVSLPAESALTSAMGNDVGYEFAYAQQVYALGQQGDILIAMSTSGNSANVVAALQAAKVKGMHTIGLTGQTNCRMDNLCDVIFHAPALETYRVQEYHLALYHILCLLVESQLFAQHSELTAS